jgi:hypothetical protein
MNLILKYISPLALLTYLVAPTFFLFLFATFEIAPIDMSLLTTLLILISFPHFMATYWLWWQRVGSWKLEAGPLLFPVLYFCLFFMSTQDWELFLSTSSILKISFLYLLYHFAQQFYGVLVWFCYSIGLKFASWEKASLRSYFLVIAFYTWVQMELRGELKVLFYHPVDAWPLPLYVADIGFFLVLGLTLLTTVVFLLKFFAFKKLSTLYPLGILSLGWLWFIPPFCQKLIYYLPILHGLQYLPFILMKGKVRQFRYWILAIGGFIVTGHLLFRNLPFDLTPSLFPGNLWPAFILSLLNNHHFLIDGRIWKLRDPENKSLLTSSQELQSQEEKALSSEFQQSP